MKKINKKSWIFIGITIVVIALVAQYMAIMPPQIDEALQMTDIVPAQELPVVTTIPATGNVDDAINAILNEAIDEQALFTDEGKDAMLLGADSQAISDFGQSFNENEL